MRLIEILESELQHDYSCAIYVDPVDGLDIDTEALIGQPSFDQSEIVGDKELLCDLPIVIDMINEYFGDTPREEVLANLDLFIRDCLDPYWQENRVAIFLRKRKFIIEVGVNAVGLPYAMIWDDRYGSGVFTEREHDPITLLSFKRIQRLQESIVINREET